MRFVEDHHFAAACRRSVAHHFTQLANLVDAAIGGRVDFDDVQRSTRRDLRAGIAYAARLGGRSIHAIQSLRQDSRGGGLTDAPRAGKNVGMGYTIVVDGVGECFGDVTLTHKITKCLGTPLTGYNLIGHSFCRTLSVFLFQYIAMRALPSRGTSGDLRHPRGARYR